MSFAIPVNDPSSIRCNAIIDRLVNYRPGCFAYDNALPHATDWIASGEGRRHPHPVIGLEGDAIIRALVEEPQNARWLHEGEIWLENFERARRKQQTLPIINLPDCRDTADLIAANID